MRSFKCSKSKLQIVVIVWIVVQNSFKKKIYTNNCKNIVHKVFQGKRIEIIWLECLIICQLHFRFKYSLLCPVCFSILFFIYFFAPCFSFHCYSFIFSICEFVFLYFQLILLIFYLFSSGLLYFNYYSFIVVIVAAIAIVVVDIATIVQ